MLGEARRHRRRRGQRRAAVAAPARLGLLQGLAEADGDERVLQAGAAAAVGVDVAGGDGGDVEALGEAGEPAVAGAVVAPVGTLQLDPEAITAEGGEQAPAEALAGGRVPPLPGAGEGAIAGAAGEADEPLGVLLQLLEGGPRRFGIAACAVAGVGVGGGQEPAEVAIAGGVLDQEGEVDAAPGAVVDGQLGTGDRPQAEALAGEGELERAPDAVVVGEGDGGIAAGRGGAGQLRRRRGAVEEGEGRVGVQLYVRSARHSGPLPVPAPAAAAPEDGEGAAVGQRQLEVVAAQGPRGPPAVLDQPLLADCLDSDTVDRRWGSAGGGLDRDGTGRIEAAQPGHQLRSPTVDR